MRNKYKKAASNAILISLLSMIGFEFILTLILLFAPAGDEIFKYMFTPVIQILCMGVIPLLVYKKIAKPSAEDFKEILSFKRMKSFDLICVIVVALGLVYINYVVATHWLTFLEQFGYYPPPTTEIFSPGLFDLFLNLGFIAILPALFEEFTFRGLLLGSFKERPIFGIFLSAFTFALMHTNIIQFGYTFVGGLIMGVLVITTGSITASVIVHFTMNFFSVIFEYLDQFEAGKYIISSIFIVLASLATVSVIIIIMYSTKMRNKIDSEKNKGKLALTIFIALGVLLTMLSGVVL